MAPLIGLPSAYQWIVVDSRRRRPGAGARPSSTSSTRGVPLMVGAAVLVIVPLRTLAVLTDRAEPPT